MIVFSLSVFIQTLLFGHNITPATGTRVILFGATIGTAWTLVRWRYFHGAQVLENLGQPRWLSIGIGGAFTSCIILLSLSLADGPREIRTTKNSIEWHIDATQHYLRRQDFDTQEQLALFDKIRMEIGRSEPTESSVSLVMVVPWILFFCLTYLGERIDLWRPIGLTGISLALIEFWLKLNA